MFPCFGISDKRFEDLTYSSSLMHTAQAEDLTFLNLTGQVISIEEYIPGNSRVSTQPLAEACFCFSYLRIQFIPGSINPTTLSNHLLSISSLSWLDNDVFKRRIIIVFPLFMCGTSVKYSCPTGCKSAGYSVASITVLTALGGKRSILESIRTIVSWYAILNRTTI